MGRLAFSIVICASFVAEVNTFAAEIVAFSADRAPSQGDIVDDDVLATAVDVNGFSSAATSAVRIRSAMSLNPFSMAFDNGVVPSLLARVTSAFALKRM